MKKKYKNLYIKTNSLNNKLSIIILGVLTTEALIMIITRYHLIMSLLLLTCSIMLLTIGTLQLIASYLGYKAEYFILYERGLTLKIREILYKNSAKKHATLYAAIAIIFITLGTYLLIQLTNL